MRAPSGVQTRRRVPGPPPYLMLQRCILQCHAAGLLLGYIARNKISGINIGLSISGPTAPEPQNPAEPD